MSGGEKPEKVITVEIKVSFHCNACERQVKKALWKVDGVESVSTDVEKQKATVTGRLIDPQLVLKKLKKKTGKRAELWPNADPPEKAPSQEGNGVAPEVTVRLPDEGTGFLEYFNDENTNSCTIA